jgi:hypothetical protein
MIEQSKIYIAGSYYKVLQQYRLYLSKRQGDDVPVMFDLVIEPISSVMAHPGTRGREVDLSGPECFHRRNL